MTEADYHHALTNTLRLEDGDEVVMLKALYPGVVITATILQSVTSSGITRYSGLYRGHTVTAFSLGSLRGQLADIDRLPDGV